MTTTAYTSPPGGSSTGSGRGETFSINLGTGTAMHRYQLPVPDGVAGHTPALALEYNSGTGLGAFGLGWRLDLRAITAGLDFGAPDDAGLFLRLLDSGSEIVQSADGTFRLLRETSFDRYTRVGSGWRIEQRNGIAHDLGTTVATRVAHPDHADRIAEWLADHSTDTFGNSIDYTYRHESGYAYPQTIRYARYEVRFDYEDRPDVRHDGRYGFSRRQTLRCHDVRLVLDPGPAERLVRSWQIGYLVAAGSQVSQLAALTMTSHGAAPDGSLDVRRPTVTFGYTPFDPSKFVPALMEADASQPPPLDDVDVALVTLDDAPLPGVLVNREGHEYYWPNDGEGKWGAPRPLRRAPLATTFARQGLAFVDMDGSGTADLMVARPDALAGYFENAGTDGWGDFVAFPRGDRAVPTWSEPSLRLLDADADGLVDAVAQLRGGLVWWRNEGRAGWSRPTLVPSGDLDSVDLASPDVYLADMTGDGLADVVRVRSGLVEYWPSLGRGRFGPRVVMAGSPRISRDTPWATTVLLDVDGDGCADLMLISGQGIRVVQNRNGTSFAAPTELPIVPAPIPGTLRALNMTGAATPGLVWNTRGTAGTRYMQWRYVGTAPAYLLSDVDNGTGLTSQIRYRSAIEDHRRDRAAGIPWTTNFPFPYLVVARTAETDHVSGRHTEVEFRYHEAHFESSTRQFQGFRTTERITGGDSSRADTREVHHFLQAQERLPGNGPGHALLNGLLARVETLADDGTALQDRPLLVESCEHDLNVLDTLPDGRQRVFIFATTHRVEDHERTDDIRIEEKTYEYDDVGNVVREHRRGSGTQAGAAVPERVEVREIQYAISATHYLLDRISRSTLRDEDGNLLSEQRLYYDGADFAGLPLGQVDRGVKSREEELVLAADAFAAHYAGMDQAALGYTSGPDADGRPSVFATSMRTRYDSRGLAIATMDPFGVISSTQFDEAGLFRIGRTDPLGTWTFGYDAATGHVIQSRTPVGAVSRFAYDAQGRVLRGALPGEDIDSPSTEYAFDETVLPNRRIVRMRQGDGSIAEHVTYFDGGGRELQQRVTVATGKILVSGWNVFNPWGAVSREFEPTFAATLAFAVPDGVGVAATPSRSLFFDARGRATRCVNFNGGVSSAEFLPFQVTTRDANDTDDSPENVARGQFDTPHLEQFDVFRDVVRVIDRIDAGTAETSAYETGPQGELVSIADANGVKFRYTYDRRGCRLSIASREAGQRRIFYDAAKRAVRTVDGAGHDILAAWDATGRLTALSSGGTAFETYTYDTAAQHALGRLAKVTYSGGRQEFEYDPAGRLVQRSFHFEDPGAGAATQTLAYEYDPCGRQTATVHTDGRRIERHLTVNGWVAAIPGVLSSVDYDARGLPVTIDCANGVRTSFEYTPGPGRISHQVTTSATQQVLEDISYTYDKLESMLASEDVAPGGAGRRAYSYDSLSQLTRTETVEGGAAVQRHYEYTSLRNLSRLDESLRTMHYDDAAHPDLLAGITVDGQARFAVTHDAGGNLKTLPGQQFEYNVKNELARLRADDGLIADYGYDHMGLRTSKRVDDGHGSVRLTQYVGSQAEIRDGVASHFVTFGGLRIAVLTGAQTVFLHNNPTGTSTLFTGADGERAGQVDVRPFGNEASRSGTVDFQTFGLHSVDPESGLVYMRRRYYAPAIGRFLTPDLMALHQPERFVHHPAGLQLYAYVGNDPLNTNDPDGLTFWSIVGAVVGIVAGVVVGLAIVAATGGLGLMAIGLMLAVSLAVTGVSYVIASNVDPNGGFGQFMRGFMIGFNAGMNFAVGSAILGGGIGAAIGVINSLAAIDGVARNSFYQGVLGWSSWVMPMSWAATALGLVFFVVNLAAAGVTYILSGKTKIDRLGFDWRTGTFVMSGGLIHNSAAFDMGHFVFMNPDYVDGSTPGRTYDNVLSHETGHTLENAAFGSAFLAADLIGENLTSAGVHDYGEEIAESHAHVHNPRRTRIPMWG